MLTRRAYFALVLVAVPLFASLGAPALLWLAGALFLVVAGIIVLDSRSVPTAAVIAVRREYEPRLSVGSENPVTLRVGMAHNRAVPLVAQVREEPPAGFSITPGPFFHAFLRADGEPDEIVYTLRPVRRGAYAFGPVTLRIEGQWGFVIRQRAVSTNDTVRVYPDIRAIRVHDLTARRQLRAASGTRRTRRPGEGGEFERLRDYGPDDEYRRIDWKATARRGKPIVRAFESERSWNVVLMLDTGRLMAAPAGDLTKLDVAVNAALLIGHVGARRGDRIGLMTFSDRVEAFVPAIAGPRQEGVLLETLYAARVQETATDYTAAFRNLVARRPPRSLVVLLTDITDAETPQTLLPTLQSVAARHRVIVVTLRDPELDALTQQPVTDADTVYGRVAASRLERERALLLRSIAGRGIETVDVPADRLSPALLNLYLDLRGSTSL